MGNVLSLSATCVEQPSWPRFIRPFSHSWGTGRGARYLIVFTSSQWTLGMLTPHASIPTLPETTIPTSSLCL